MPRLTRDLQIELATYNAGIERARMEHNLNLAVEQAARAREIRRAKADLLVATSVEECADLLAVIDRLPTAPARCGTPSGYKRHRRLKEDACAACRAAHAAAARRRRALDPAASVEVGRRA